jgi:lysophospholipase L1-like esterase
MQTDLGADLHNVQSISPSEDGHARRLCRVREQTRLQLNAGAQQRAFNTAGCEIRFNLLGPSATIRLRRPPGNNAAVHLVEIYYGSFQSTPPESPIAIATTPTEIKISQPSDGYALWELAHSHDQHFDPELVRVILPYDESIELIDIHGDIAPPRPDQLPQRRYLAYGSSITQGFYAVRPSETYIAQTARLLGADLMNLGFAGSAHMDLAIAEHIAARQDWDFVTLELGTNVLNHWSEEQYEHAVRPFISTIAKAHPDKPIFCIDIFTCDRDLRPASIAQDFRYILRHAIHTMDLPNIHHIPGMDLLTAAGLTTDLVHPSALGMEMIAGRLAERIKANIKPLEKVRYILPRAEVK